MDEDENGVAAADEQDRFRKQVMNFHGNDHMDVFTCKRIIRLFDIGKNGNFKGFPDPGSSY